MSRSIKWTVAEIGFLRNLPETDTNWVEVAETIALISGNKRSANATRKKWKSLPTEIDILSKPSLLNKKESNWTNEKDFFLLVNFYDMSIDEVREHFDMGYGEVATRLEYLFDSAEPSHIEMLMKASVAVRESREPYLPNESIGAFSRKQKRIIRKIIRLNDKLERLRGE